MQDNRQSQQVVPPSPYGALNDQSQPSIDLLIRKLKSLEVQQRQKAEIRPSGDSLSRRDSINSPLKVGNINIFNMPKTLDKSKNTQHKVSQSETIHAYQASLANILASETFVKMILEKQKCPEA